MVILGASAPKCGSKPSNPTSSSKVGTMIGQAAGDSKQAQRVSTVNNAHRTTYQGLLQAPRIPGIFDHQLIKTSYEDNNSNSKQGQKQGGSQSPKGVQKNATSVSGVIQTGDVYGLIQGAVGKPKTSQPQQHRYHYQKFNSQSATNFGGIGGQKNSTKPGQKSIKQQRDLAQLRFYQTLTNQPHLISQAQTQGNKLGNAGGQVTPNQVKMLSNMRMAQQPGSRGIEVQQNYGGVYSRNKSQNINVNQQREVRKDTKSGQATLRTSQISNFDRKLGNNLQDQQRAQTTQGANNAPRRHIGTAPTSYLLESQGERALSGLNSDVNQPLDTQLIAKKDQSQNQDESMDLVDIPSPQPNRIVTAQEAGFQNKVETATSQPNIQDYVQIKDDPYEQRRGTETAARMEEVKKIPSSGQRSSTGIMNALHGPVPGGGRLTLQDTNQKKSSATIKQYESQRASQDTGFLGRSGVAGNSQSPYRSNLSGLKSEVKRVKGSKSKNSMGIHVSKIEKKHQFGTQAGFSSDGITNEEYQMQMDRFSSQGQEELVQAYQLPTVYTNNESKAGFMGYKSQHIDKRRNYTSYGGQRQSAAAGIAARNYEYMRQSAASTNYNSGGVAPRSMMGGPQQKDQIGKLPSTAISGPRGNNQQSQGALSNLMVKTCNFQPRDMFTQRREQIKNDYSLPPKSANVAALKSGLPKIGQGKGQTSQVTSANNVQKALSQTRPSAVTQLRADTTDLKQIAVAPPSTTADNVLNPTLHPTSHEATKRDEMKPLSQTQIIQERQQSRDRSNSNQRHHCERFMRRGNKPVLVNYEEKEEPVISKALIPYIGSDEPLKKRMIGEQATGKVNTSQSGRQMVYGNMKLGNFDEEISGINLSKLFSVYGPQSAEGYKRKKLKPENQGTGIGGQLIKNTELDNQRGLQIQGDDYRAVTKLLKDEGSNDPSMIQQRNNIPTVDGQYISSGPSKADNFGSDQDNQGASGWYQRRIDDQKYLGDSPTDLGEDDSSMEDSDEDEEPLIIQLMESMFSRKKTVFETEQLISEISLEEIRQEFRNLAMREKCRITDLERAKVFEQRMNECEKLNKLIQLENEEAGTSLFDGPDKSARENPFYQALKAQKEERERYKQMLQLAIAGPQEIVTPQEQTFEDPKSLAIESEQPKEDPSNDIFKHTFVDILDEEKDKNKHTKNLYDEQKQKELKVQKQQKEIFFFYNFSFDLPTEYYKQLGDFDVIKRPQAQKIKEFMANTWPVLKGKKVQYKIAYDQNKDVYNVVLLGKDCPLSKCCKMTVYFQFTRDIGGKVICMENLCALNPLDHFQIDLGLIQSLFYDQQIGTQITEGSHIQQEIARHIASKEALTKKQYKKLKPTFKKVISQEISKMISKGTHMNMSIRDYISSQDLEEKVQHHVTKGKAGMIGRPQQAPPKLTQQNLMKLLYDTSTIQTSSQNSHLAGDSQQLMLDSVKQPIQSIEWNNQNTDIGFALNPQMYDQMIGLSEHYAQNEQLIPFNGLNEPLMYQVNMDQVDELILSNQISQQNAVLFSHAALEEALPENPNLQLTDSKEMNVDNIDAAVPIQNTQAWIQGNNDQAEVKVVTTQAQQKTTGTFNPTPQLVVKSNLTPKESNKIQESPGVNHGSMTPKVLISGQSDANVIFQQQLETNPDAPVIEKEKQQIT